MFAASVAVLAFRLGLLPWWAAPLVVAGALLPDIDHPRSILGRRMPFVGWILTHRMFTHSFLFAGLLALIHPALGLGCAAHILLDAVNPTGCPLLYPIRSRRYSLGEVIGSVSTGSGGERTAYLLAIVFLILSLWSPRF